MTTWAQQLQNEMRAQGDQGPVVRMAPSPDAFSVEFNGGFGGSEGPPVLAWTESRVYFPVVYDGSEWMGSAPRNPTRDGQEHVGGE